MVNKKLNNRKNKAKAYLLLFFAFPDLLVFFAFLTVLREEAFFLDLAFVFLTFLFAFLLTAFLLFANQITSFVVDYALTV